MRRGDTPGASLRAAVGAGLSARVIGRRPPDGWPMNQGFDVRGNLFRDYGNGSVKIYGKYLDDRNHWYEYLLARDPSLQHAIRAGGQSVSVPLKGQSLKVDLPPQAEFVPEEFKFSGDDHGQKAKFKVVFSHIGKERRYSTKVWAAVPQDAE